MTRRVKPLKRGLYLLHLALLLHAAIVLGSSSELQQEAKLTTVGVSTKVLTKTAAGDAYDAFIRELLVPRLQNTFLQLGQDLRTSPFHEIARKWHSFFTFQLTQAKFPDSLKQEAAAIHKRMGGLGDFLNALPSEEGDKAGAANLKKGPLRNEFISYALFFLKAFVKEDIAACRKAGERASECLEPFKEDLRLALTSTLSAFFEFVLPRLASRRMAAVAFMIVAVSPCPFSQLTDPQFIYGALSEAPKKTLAAAAAAAATEADACPQEKERLLRVLLGNGVTLADRMRLQDLKGDLAKMERGQALQAEEKEIKELTAVGEKLLKGKEEEDLELETAEDVIKLLTSLYTSVPHANLDFFLNSPAGERMKSAFESLNGEEGRAFRNRLKAFLRGQEKEDFSFASLLREEAIKGLAEEFKKEEEENPQGVPLKKKKTESKQEEASTMLEHVRHPNFRLSPLRPPKEKKGEGEEGEGNKK